MLKIAYILISLFLFLSITACQTTKTAKNNSFQLKSEKQKVISEKRIKEQEIKIQDLKDQNRIESAKQKHFSNSIPLAPQPVFNSDLKASSEQGLFFTLQKHYDLNDQKEFNRSVQAFRNKFPKSHLMDEVVYLQGLMHLSGKKYGNALKSFDEVIKKYPMSAKVSSAHFAKAVTYKRMNLNEQSAFVFKNVVKRYPGSPEAIRAKVELNILKR